MPAATKTWNKRTYTLSWGDTSKRNVVDMAKDLRKKGMKCRVIKGKGGYLLYTRGMKSYPRK